MSTFFVGGNVLRIYKYILCFVSVLPNQLHFRRRHTVHQSINHHAFNKFSYKTFWPHQLLCFFSVEGHKSRCQEIYPNNDDESEKSNRRKSKHSQATTTTATSQTKFKCIVHSHSVPPKKTLIWKKKHQRKQWNIHFVKKKEIKRKLAHAHAQRNQMNDETMWKWKCGIIWIDVFIITPEII